MTVCWSRSQFCCGSAAKPLYTTSEAPRRPRHGDEQPNQQPLGIAITVVSDACMRAAASYFCPLLLLTMWLLLVADGGGGAAAAGRARAPAAAAAAPAASSAPLFLLHALLLPSFLPHQCMLCFCSHHQQ